MLNKPLTQYVQIHLLATCVFALCVFSVHRRWAGCVEMFDWGVGDFAVRSWLSQEMQWIAQYQMKKDKKEAKTTQPND